MLKIYKNSIIDREEDMLTLDYVVENYKKIFETHLHEDAIKIVLWALRTIDEKTLESFKTRLLLDLIMNVKHAIFVMDNGYEIYCELFGNCDGHELWKDAIGEVKRLDRERYDAFNTEQSVMLQELDNYDYFLDYQDPHDDG